MTFALGLPLFIALACFAERRNWTKSKSIGLQVPFLSLLLVYYFVLPERVVDQPLAWTRFLLLMIGLHFCVAVLPFLDSRKSGFWRFNATLFQGFLHAVLYSSVLYIGIVVALLALDYLFGVDVDEERYLQLWYIMAGVFNTWLFLARIPKDLNGLGEDKGYPKGLKAFAQFALIPLVILYFAILITYEAKVIFLWDWPKGWVGQLVLWYSVVGTLSLLLLYPLRKLEENKWIQAFIRWFFYGLIPLIVMLFIAIYIRITEYGITPPRYSVVAMAIGLTIVTLYFVASKRRDIRIIPLVLAILAFLSAFGPWGAFAISERSQQARFEEMLIENELWSMEGGITPRKDNVDKTERELRNLINHLYDWYGPGAFDQWYPDEVFATPDTLLEADTLEAGVRSILAVSHPKAELGAMLGLKYPAYLEPGRGFSPEAYFSFWTEPANVIALDDYDYLVDLDRFNWASTVAMGMAGDTCRLWFDADTKSLTLRIVSEAGQDIGGARVPLNRLLNLEMKESRGGRNIDSDSLTIRHETDSISCLLKLNSISGYRGQNRLEVQNLSGVLLVRLTEKR